MSKKAVTLALYADPDEAGNALRELRDCSVPGFKMDDVIIKSPIDHPELTELLNHRPVYIQLFTLLGVLLGPTTGLVLIASAQASFIYQTRGGRPIVPFPPDMVLTYELFILSGVLMTVISTFVAMKLPGNRSPLYNASVSEDKIGILVKAEAQNIPHIDEILRRHNPTEIKGDHSR
ncbi:MAG: DUF3341 domain-containing protein [Betaproteobacteria bacterium]|jgi:Protein of unknown function (DUF3341).|nr:DUF3341 domain-containing protein [Betaproteobacteria bacterium]